MPEQKEIRELAEKIISDFGDFGGVESIIGNITKFLSTLRIQEREKWTKEVIEQLEVLIFAQETSIKDKAELLGLNKWLNGGGIIETKYHQDKLSGQKDLLRIIKKGYIPALTLLEKSI